MRALKHICMILFLFPALSFARGSLLGYCTQGGAKVFQNGVPSTTQVMQSYPQCSITVYVTGGPSGSVTTSGTAVTLASGTLFNANSGWPGLSITINSVTYTILSVSSTTSLTLTSSAGTQAAPVAYSMASTAPAAIYDSTGTAKTNPFASSKTGLWQFYADNGQYDIQLSGGGIPAPFTWAAQTLINPFSVPSWIPYNPSDGTIASQCTTAASANKTLVIANLVSMPTQTMSCQLLFLAGGKLQPGSGQTVTIAGTITANSQQQIFDYSTSGTVLLTKVTSVYPDWWGIGSDMGLAMNRAKSATLSTGAQITVNPGAYLTCTPILIDKVMKIVGGTGYDHDAGPHATTRLTWSNGCGAGPILDLELGSTGSTITGLAFDNLDATLHMFVDVNATGGIALDEILIDRPTVLATQYGIRIGHFTGTTANLVNIITLDNSQIIAAAPQGVLMTNVYQPTIRKTSINNNTIDQLVLGTASGSEALDVTLDALTVVVQTTFLNPAQNALINCQRATMVTSVGLHAEMGGNGGTKGWVLDIPSTAGTYCRTVTFIGNEMSLVVGDNMPAAIHIANTDSSLRLIGVQQDENAGGPFFNDGTGTGYLVKNDTGPSSLTMIGNDMRFPEASTAGAATNMGVIVTETDTIASGTKQQSYFIGPLTSRTFTASVSATLNGTAVLNAVTSFTSGLRTLANGANANVSMSGIGSSMRIVGPTGSYSMSGFTAGTDGQLLYLFGVQNQTATLTNLATSSAANQIQTNTGADIVCGATKPFTATLMYSTSSAKWIVISVGPGCA